MRATFADAVIDEEVLRTGRVRLTPGAANSIGLPKETVERSLRFGDEWIPVVWSHEERLLGGEALLDFLELEATLESALRLLREDDGTIAVRLIDRSSSTVGRRALRRGGGQSATSTAPGEASGERVSAGGETTDPETQRERGGAPTGSRPARSRRNRFAARADREFDWHGDIGVSKTSREERTHSIEAARWTDGASFEMRVSGEELAAVSGFDELLALDMCAIDHMPHQVGTALAVLRNLNGRAILADEVGLGKTIEAGLVIKELLVRQMATSVLIICPATLRDQWSEEMDLKFHERFEVVERGTESVEHDRVILSHQMAQRRVADLTARSWDIVVVDEAHRMSGAGARRSRELLTGLESRYALYLTATPVQNDLLELYRLVDALRPGTFTSQRDFKKRFVHAGNPREPKDPAALRRLVADVMVRTTRAQAGLDRVQRIPVDHRIEMSEAERLVYDFCLDTLRTELNGPHDAMRRRFLAHRLTASPRALAQSLQRLAETDVKPKLRETLEEMVDLCIDFGVTERQRRLLALSHEWIGDRDKGRVLVFTQHTDTLQDLDRVLTGQGLDTVTYHGQMSATAKRRSIEDFASDRGPRVMISSDAGAEGLNLQFANCVVNYDLPWNPMRIEQRIGRVHRVTQTRDVHVANLYATNTVDEAVYRLLHDKLRMFELLFGQVTTILGELDETRDAGTFEDRIMDAVTAADDRAMRAKLDELGRSVDTAYTRAQAQSVEGDHLNTWVLDRSHRKSLTKEGSSELRPEAVVSEGERRTAVEEFVHGYLERVGATITWEQRGSAHRSGFVSATLPPAVAERLGRDELNLAFGADSLDLHASAELCVVGMGIFDELVSTIADEVEILAEIPSDVALEPTEVWIGGADGYEFVERRIYSYGQWGGRAVWQVRNRAVQEGPTVVTTFVGEDPAARGGQEVLRQLGSGESLPMTGAGATVDSMIEASIPQLREVADTVSREIAEAHEQERERLKRHYDEQIEEARAGSQSRGAEQRNRESRALVGRLRRARKELLARRPPTVRLEADLLALHLVPAPRVEVIETWWSPEGEQFEVFYEWTVGSDRPASIPGADGGTVETLALCRRTHVVDEQALRRCSVCEEDTCGACTDGVQASCGVCLAELCGRCAIGRRQQGSWVTGDSVVCPACHNPEVIDTGDTETVLALGNGLRARVDPWSVRITDIAGETVLDHVLPQRWAALAYPQIDELEELIGSEVGLSHRGEARLGEPSNLEVASRMVSRWSIRRHGGLLQPLGDLDGADAVLSGLTDPGAADSDGVVGHAPAMVGWLEAVGERHGFRSGPVVEFSRHEVRHELSEHHRPRLQREFAEIDARPTVSAFRLQELSPADRSLLPDELLVTGAVSVRAARDGGLLVVAIRSVARRELAVLEDGRIARWVTLETDEAETELMFRFAAVLGDGGMGLSIVSHGMPSEPEETHLVADHRRWVLDLEASDSTGRRILSHDLGEVEDPDPTSHLDRVADLAGPALEVLPLPVSGSEAKTVARVVDGVTAPAPKVSLSVLTRIEIDRVDLTGEGLSRIRGRVPDLVVEKSDWMPSTDHETGPELAGLGATALISSCELGDYRSEMVRYGPYHLLTITDPAGQRSLWRLDDLPHFPAGAIAADRLGSGTELPRPVRWSPPPDPGETPFTVAGYEMVDRNFDFDRAPSSNAPIDRGAEERFYAFIGADDVPDVELSGELPYPLQHDFAATARFEPTIVRPNLRARVTERWVLYGTNRDQRPSEVTVEYLCESDGRALVDAHLGSMGPALSVDRSGHVVDHAETCPYCTQLVCSSCPEPMTTCSACGIRLCARCLPETGWCEACGSVKKVGLLGRRSLPGRSKHAVRGRDRIHEVTYVLVRHAQAVMLVKAQGLEPFEKQVTLPAGLAERFEELAGGTWSSGVGGRTEGFLASETDSGG